MQKKKKQRPNPNRSRSMMALALVLLIGLAGIAAYQVNVRTDAPITPGRADRLLTAEAGYRETAREFWEGQVVVHYRYTVTVDWPQWVGSPECSATVDVRHGTDVQVSDNTCALDDQLRSATGWVLDSCTDAVCDAANLERTIPQWFDFLAQFNEERACGPNGCECDGLIYFHTTYHERLGFPEEMTMQLSGPTTSGLCTEIGFLNTRYRIHNFQVVR